MSSNKNNTDSLKHSFKSSLKSMDTEETIDLLFYRPIGYLWAVICAKLGITPNAITIASIFIGVAAGVLFYFPSLFPYNVVGILLLILADSLDSADGQLARMTHQYSRLGRILDGLSGDIWFVTIYIAICLRTNNFHDTFGTHHWIIWLIAALAGVCHAKQAAAADYYRQFHLYFVKGAEGSELDSCNEIDIRYAGMKWKGNFWNKITTFFYRHYTANQEALTPAMQHLRATLRTTFAGGTASDEFRTEFRSMSKPLMKYTNWLTFNLRTIALFVCIIIGEPWWYFIFELTVLNAMLWYMMHRHELMCRTLDDQLKAGKFTSAE